MQEELEVPVKVTHCRACKITYRLLYALIFAWSFFVFFYFFAYHGEGFGCGYDVIFFFFGLAPLNTLLSIACGLYCFFTRSKHHCSSKRHSLRIFAILGVLILPLVLFFLFVTLSGHIRYNSRLF